MHPYEGAPVNNNWQAIEGYELVEIAFNFADFSWKSANGEVYYRNY